jgi:hypothetical protein
METPTASNTSLEMDSLSLDSMRRVITDTSAFHGALVRQFEFLDAIQKYGDEMGDNQLREANNLLQSHLKESAHLGIRRELVELLASKMQSSTLDSQLIAQVWTLLGRLLGFGKTADCCLGVVAAVLLGQIGRIASY